MKVKELLKMYHGEYADVEIYIPRSIGEHYPTVFHTDNCEWVYSDSVGANVLMDVNFEKLADEEVGLYELMDEEEYNNSIRANSSEPCPTFDELYGNSSEKVLCIMIK